MLLASYDCMRVIHFSKDDSVLYISWSKELSISLSSCAVLGKSSFCGLLGNLMLAFSEVLLLWDLSKESGICMEGEAYALSFESRSSATIECSGSGYESSVLSINVWFWCRASLTVEFDSSVGGSASWGGKASVLLPDDIDCSISRSVCVWSS